MVYYQKRIPELQCKGLTDYACKEGMKFVNISITYNHPKFPPCPSLYNHPDFREIVQSS